MTTAKKARSTSVARKQTVAPDTNGEKKKTAAKSRTKPARTTPKKSTARPAPVHGAPLSGSSICAVAAPNTAMGTNETETALQGGKAPGARAATPDALHRMIAEAAYFRAERRGFVPGAEELDWFQAEAEVRGAEHRA